MAKRRNRENPPDLRRIAGWTAAILFVLALIAYLVISVVAADRLTPPERVTDLRTPADVGLEYWDVRLTPRPNDGEQSIEIAGWYIAAGGNAPAVVMTHGRHGSRGAELGGRWVEVAEGFHAAGFSVLMIDLRGHGSSGAGRLTFGIRERYDVAGAVDWLLDRGYAPGQIALYGLSLGAASSIGAAAETPEVRAVIADASYADVHPLIEREWENETGMPFLFWPSTRLMTRILYGYDPAAARPAEDIARVAPRPVLLIHGTNDGLVPVEHARELQAAHGTAELWEIEGAGHARTFQTVPAEYTERVTAFLAEAFSTAGPAPE